MTGHKSVYAVQIQYISVKAYSTGTRAGGLILNKNVPVLQQYLYDHIVQIISAMNHTVTCFEIVSYLGKPSSMYARDRDATLYKSMSLSKLNCIFPTAWTKGWASKLL